MIGLSRATLRPDEQQAPLNAVTMHQRFTLSGMDGYKAYLQLDLHAATLGVATPNQMQQAGQQL